MNSQMHVVSFKFSVDKQFSAISSTPGGFTLAKIIMIVMTKIVMIIMR